jgi:signal transduction histidine kinase
MKRRVMVVEDDPELGPSLADLLTEAGYDVQVAVDGREAMKELNHAPRPDVILLDLMMPNMDGWEFRVAQRENDELARTPVIVLSADPSAKARAIDADRFMAKPFEGRELLQTIEEVLAEHSEDKNSESRLAALESVSSDLVRHLRGPVGQALRALEALEFRLAVGGLTGPKGRQEALQLVRDARSGDAQVCRLLDDLEVFARGDELRRTEIDLSSLVEAAIAMAFARLRHKARIQRDLGPVPAVLADQAQLLAVLTHIISNAIQALPDEADAGGDVLVATRTSPGGHAVVEVTDNGWGMMPSVRERIFEPFFTTRPGRHAGLGLAVCRGIVRGMGGRIECDSTFGRGTTVRLVLPPTPRSSEHEA